jgi:AraC-like DNA-binding protein
MSLSAVLLRVIVDAAERAGVDRGALLAAAGIDEERLSQAHHRFELAELVAIETHALDLTGDEALGLRIGEHVSESSMDLVAHVVSHATTLRQALELCSQFQRLALDDCRVTTSERDALATIRYEFARTTERADRMHAEFVVGGLSRLVRTFLTVPPSVFSVSFEHARPAYAAEYTRLFGPAVRFGERATAIVFDRDRLDRPQLHQHPQLLSVLRAEAERALARLTAGERPSDQVRQYLAARPPARIPDAATAAKELGISERSLRRRLAAEKTSYRALVRATLEASAGHMLRDPNRSIQETAHALGFSDAGAFHRAFKRWTGRTPKQYRDGTGGGEP